VLILAFLKIHLIKCLKQAVRQLTKSLALDWGKKSVRVNNICPGYIKSRMTLKSYKNLKTTKEKT
jgi:NAD(P)-dependent dehydrogenase (short-subunit alcohol dehydrogenase family)